MPPLVRRAEHPGLRSLLAAPLTLSAALLTLAAILAPWAQSRDMTALFAALDFLPRRICHQLPERCPAIFGGHAALCLVYYCIQ